MQTAFFIDGFNFYHSIKRLDRQLRWFDYKAYCRHFLRASDSLCSVNYFTALAYWRADSAARHQMFIEATEVNGVNVILGMFKEKNLFCPNCHTPFNTHEEKATDVNIALEAYRVASRQEIEQIIFVTGDTDLLPAIRMIKSDFPEKRIGVVFPLNRVSKELCQEAHFYHRTRRKILDRFQLPEVIQSPQGKIIQRPPTWR